ncbi:MAG: hypothetical protein ACLQVY_02315 [Limisphaerales bacterium]
MSASAKEESSPGGTIPDQAEETLLMLWIFASAWMAASVFIVAPMVSDALKEQDYARLVTLAFPAVGLGLLLWALRRSLRVRKFGGSILHVNMDPAKPGGELAAVIHVDRPVPGGGPIRLRLRCIQRSTTRKSKTERVLWQQSQNLDKVHSNLDGTEIPVRFHIPADAPATNGVDLRREILWRLEARGPSGLVNYFSRFEVPVGVAAVQETAPETPAQAPLHRGLGPDPRAQLRERGIDCQSLAGGGLHLHLAAGRRKLIGPTVIGLIFTGIAVALFLAPLPDLMRIITISLGALLLLPGAFFGFIVTYNWLVSQDVKARQGSLVMERRALFFHWGRTFNVSEIAEITCQKDGESSSSNSGVATFHGIQLKARDGKCTWLASNISQADYAAWLTDEINAALGWLPES